jgi:glyoxalase family protein
METTMTTQATTSAGIHHITAIAGDPKRNVAFYTQVLGLRLVKKTVNFDDPGTYHLYYGDETGRPGTILTFFPWAHVGPGRNGIGLAVETAFAIPAASVGFWIERLISLGIAHDAPEKRFGDTVIGLRDPDGMRLELVGVQGLQAMPGYATAGVPADHAVRGFHGISLWVGEAAGTARVLTEAFGYKAAGQEGNRHRYVAPSPAGTLAQVVDLRVAPGFLAGAMGAGTIHHVAFRAATDADQAAMSASLRKLGLRVTEQMDRNYFRSVYFKEPAGIIFEIATDAPGFTVDEDLATLGQSLKLPEWYEPRRKDIEAVLPALV